MTTLSDLTNALTVSGIAISVLGFICKELVDSLERTKTSLHDQLASNRVSSGQQSIQLQLLTARQHLEVLQREKLPKSQRKRQDIDYSVQIPFDIAALTSAQSVIRLSLDDVSRLIEKLAFRPASIRQTFDQLKAKIEADNQQAKDVLKPSSNHSWTRVVEVRIAVVSILVGALPLVVLEDQIISTANAQMKLLDFVIRFGRWAIRLLYISGAFLILYGLRKGVRVHGLSE
jgi:hypothetical protein